jgi:potassium-dependent mechanosensitive channel
MVYVFKTLCRLLQSSLDASIIAVTVASFLTIVPVMAAEQKPAEAPKPSAPPAPPVIPVEEVATQATQVTNLLGGLETKFASSAEIEAIARAIRDFNKLIDLEIVATKNVLEEQPSLELLQTQQQLWQRAQLQTTEWLNALTERATELQNARTQLEGLIKTWIDTRAAAQAAQAPVATLQQIDATRASLQAAQIPLQKQRVAVLDLQSQVAKRVALCNSVLVEIAQAQQKAVAGILVRESPQIWRAELWTDALTLLPERIPKVAARYRADVLGYLFDPSRGMPWHGEVFVLLVVVFLGARWRLSRWNAAGDTSSSAVMVLNHPIAAASLVTFVIAASPYSQMPTAVRQVYQILLLVPTIILTRPVAGARLAPGLYALALFFTIDILRQPFVGAPGFGQAILILESFAGLLVSFWLRSRSRRADGETAGSSRLPAFRIVIYLFILAFVIGVVAGSLGYVRLARLMVSGILAAGALALALYAAVRVASALIAFLLRVWPLRLFRMVEHNRLLLERRAYGLFLWMAVGGWLFRYLDYVGLLEPASSLAKAVLAAKLERGSVSISVEDVLVFVLTVWVAYLLSAFIRFMLEEDVYPRINLSPGQSYAASSLLNYIIIALGFVAALGALGVDFSKVTILAGAFSVGIGFGLQSVVNNFVSGLILLFERPIKVGDVVVVGSIQGRVNNIGMRASIVRTPQGAEIILPNAQLITQEVTNWTRSDQLRRVDLPVGVSYGTAPKQAIELFESVARAHPQVLQYPPPRALFTGYGDSSINFELRAWTEYINWVQVHSDLTVAVYEAVYAAGLSFPFPQREVRLLGDSKATPVVRPDNAGKKPL